MGVTEYGGVLDGDGLTNDGADNESGAGAFGWCVGQVEFYGAAVECGGHELAFGVTVENACVEPPAADKGAWTISHNRFLTVIVAPGAVTVSYFEAMRTATVRSSV